MNARTLALTFLALAASTFASCSRGPLTGPPKVVLGREECAGCGMLVDEDRCSSALLIERDQERLYAHFDDLGCMLDYELEKGGQVNVIERYVRDFSDRSWLPAPAALFVVGSPDRLRTPMGSGLVAFANPTAADAALTAYSGQRADYTRLVSIRREKAAARLAPATPAP